MKIVVTGTRGVPNIMGGVETHCEELFPRVAKRGFDVTIIRRSNYVQDDLKEWNGVKLVTIPSPKKKSLRLSSILSVPSTRQRSLGLTCCTFMLSVLPCSFPMPSCWA